MLYALWEILIPLLLALGLGWLLTLTYYKWRRRFISASEWNTLTSKTQRAEIELASTQAAHDEVTNERSMLSARLATLTSSYDSSQTELTASVRSVEVLAADLETSRAEVSTLRTELQDSASRVHNLEEDVNSAQATIAGYVSLEGDLTSTRNDLVHADARAGEAEGRASELEGRLSTSQADLTGVRSDLSGSSDRISQLEGGAAAAALTAASLRDAEARANELDTALISARKELDTSQSRIADLDAHLSTARADIDAAHARVGELEGELGGAQSRISGFANLEAEHSEIEDLRQTLANTDSRFASVQAELAAAKADLRDSLKEQRSSDDDPSN